ncbi:MAG: carboxypeptidase regulatory-like domain-containing protein [Acidobacteria bacterium]|nr:carboxypeptidase regulatory-like domain-containing protein [Acidobacteriota bacterium]
MTALRLCFVLVTFVCVATAQDYRARVQGLVADATQAAVAGAKVTLRNVNTGVEIARDSTADGRYIFDFVEPGTYTITAEMAGFAKASRENLVVQTRADVTADFALKPGTVVESVEVTGTAVQLAFNSSTRDLTIDRKQLTDLPVKARNPFTLALLDPAVVNRYIGFDRNPYFMWSSSSIDVGGNTSRKNDLLLDGAPLQIGPKGSYAPPMDATQEFTVQQNSVDAEFGHSAGGILSLSMKSGTNEVHGTASYFGRNPVFNAVSNPLNRRPNQIRNHIYGGTIGGPIQKNKLFTFGTYEGWRTKEPLNAQRTLPTNLERTGDFSRSLNARGGLRTIHDPSTTQLINNGAAAQRMPFPGNIVPASRIDPTSATIMKDIWTPNGAGDDITGINNFRLGYFWFVNNWNFANRTDYNFNDKLKLFGRYSQFKTTLDQANYTPNNSPAMPNDNGGLMDSRNIAGELVYTMSARTVINFRSSFAEFQDNYRAPKQAVGLAGLDRFWPGNTWYSNYIGEQPAIYYPGVNISTVGGTSSYGRAGYWFQEPSSFNLSGKLSRFQGKHYLKAGTDIRYHQAHGQSFNFMNFNFSGGPTSSTHLVNDPLSGDGHATFLLGILDNNSVVNSQPLQHLFLTYYSAFFHDDIKLTRNITINAGLRWEYETAPYDETDRLSRFLDLGSPNPTLRTSAPAFPSELSAVAKPNFNGRWIYSDSDNRRWFQSQRNILLPRLGVAIRVNDQTAVQIGWGRYMVPPQTTIGTISRIANYDGFSGSTTGLPMVDGVPQSQFSNPFPAGRNPLVPVVGRGFGENTNLGGAATFAAQNFRPGINDRLNLSLQRTLPGQFKGDFTYFTNFGRSLDYTRDLNQIDPQYRFGPNAAFYNQTTANPFFNYSTPGNFPGQLRSQRNVSRLQLLRPYPQYTSIQQQFTPGINNRYQALQIRMQRAYSNGLSLLFAFNYNRERNTFFFNEVDQYADKFTWLRSNNPRHRLTMAGTYDLPVGKGRKFLAGTHPVLNGILGGWSTSNFFYFRSGEFLRFPTAQVDGNPSISNPGPSAWFNQSAFRPQPAFTVRSNPNQYEGITGPGYWNLDSTLAKEFRITENIRFELKMEAYNLTNSFWWGNPNMGAAAVGTPQFGRSFVQNPETRGREFQYSMKLIF